jgi:hypothetical protein
MSEDKTTKLLPDGSYLFWSWSYRTKHWIVRLKSSRGEIVERYTVKNRYQLNILIAGVESRFAEAK